MRLHCIQHAPFEGPGEIENWCRDRGHVQTLTRQFSNEALPDPASIDGLVVLGGPMSVNDEQKVPWMRAEKEYIRRVIGLEIPILGICLGAQMIASALDAEVTVNTFKEIGWFDVDAVDDGVSGCGFRFPRRFTAFHWHGETFALPAGGERIARSVGCENQAFRLGERILALQFHLEITARVVQELVTNCRQDLTVGRYVQGESQLLAAPMDLYESANKIMRQLFDSYFLSG
jgi:GMP synthase-like glutamine amidotransferase